MKILLIFILGCLSCNQKNENFRKLNPSTNGKFGVLVFTETKGFVHGEAIKEGITLITNLGVKNNFNVYQSNLSEDINEENLKKINSVIFLCTTLNVLNETEQVVMQNFIRNGGGYLGIHSAADTEYDWEWYGGLVGGYFKSHPKIQPAKIITSETNHIATKHLEKSWEIEDEWYNYKDFNPEINVLLYLDESSYVGGENGDYHPITWYHEYDGGRSFYTGLGHKASTYYDKRFIKLLKGGLYYVSGY